jgi:glutamine synthetase
MNKIKVEYIWIDGHTPTQKMRGKTKIMEGPITDISQLPDWGFDGSSTFQAEGNFSDCILKPVRIIKDPIRGGENIKVLCEVFNPDGTPHETNYRAKLREISERYSHHEPLWGIEQEYTLFDGIKPLGWPDNGFPAPQGGYYCGVGSDEVYGRQLVEEHMDACIHAGIEITGVNAEVMPAQWEFQIGPVGSLEVADETWLARWLLYRLGEEYGVSATLHPKPVKGDWNGAGAHTNFSTKEMREDGGMKYIIDACEKLGKKHQLHISAYGAHNEERLTGSHETCSMDEFRFGVSDRGASIRIPANVDETGKGYLEDRRPSSNMDPYRVCTLMLETICGSD